MSISQQVLDVKEAPLLKSVRATQNFKMNMDSFGRWYKSMVVVFLNHSKIKLEFRTIIKAYLIGNSCIYNFKNIQYWYYFSHVTIVHSGSWSRGGQFESRSDWLRQTYDVEIYCDCSFARSLHLEVRIKALWDMTLKTEVPCRSRCGTFAALSLIM
jgi:hypothetical protein